jgi:hypothetical protein
MKDLEEKARGEVEEVEEDEESEDHEEDKQEKETDVKGQSHDDDNAGKSIAGAEEP